jgi:hypothetical protein
MAAGLALLIASSSGPSTKNHNKILNQHAKTLHTFNAFKKTFLFKTQGLQQNI